jgi:uncharacterized membrane protein YjgN (DUF898 family)
MNNDEANMAIGPSPLPDNWLDDVATKASGAGSTLALRFTGSGWEYWRIWIVNLLLTVVTLGVYYPWARARKWRYVYNNTWVDGDALDYHATGWRLFKGMVVAVLLFGVLNVVGDLSLLLAGVTSLAFWLLLPLLWRSSLRFRLAQSSWRGLRFGFTGGVQGAYAAFYWPWLVALIALAAAFAVGAVVSMFTIGSGVGVLQLSPHWWAMVWLATVAALTVCVLAFAHGVRRYQHSHYAFGTLGSALGLSWSDLLRAAWRPVALGVGLLTLGVVLLIVAGLLAQHDEGNVAQGPLATAAVISFVPMVYLGLPLVGAYWSALFQNLYWSATRAPGLQLRSQLSPWRYTGLVLKNLVLTLMTLGLYWPFALMATTRMRVEALSIVSEVDWAQITARAAGDGNSLGDMAMDVEGFDFGL